VSYQDPASLHFALLGCDTVLSTVTGPNQIELIKAAVMARVRRFAPAEYEGSPRPRDPTNPLDRHRSAALTLLAHYAKTLESTVFVCGIFYERFQPGGLSQSRNIMSTYIGTTVHTTSLTEHDGSRAKATSLTYCIQAPTDPAEANKVKIENPGTVTSDSLAAESIKQGGDFAADSSARGPSGPPSASTTHHFAEVLASSTCCVST
jgi:hypothetical protein